MIDKFDSDLIMATQQTIQQPTQLVIVKSLNKKEYKGKIIAISAWHNLRENKSERRSLSHIDKDRTPQNIILRGAANSVDVAKEAAQLMKEAKLKIPLRANAVLGIEILVTLPVSTGINEREFFEASVVWAGEFFGIPILSAVIHNDEAAPHCHIILLPVSNGQMIGSELIGGKDKLFIMHADFHAKVGQVYGLRRGEPAKRYSKSARALAASAVIDALRKSPKMLDDPAIRDALRDAITEKVPVSLMALLGVDMPQGKQPKPKTFVGIMSKKLQPENPIGNCRKIPIGNNAATSDQKEHPLCSVGFRSKSIEKPIPQRRKLTGGVRKKLLLNEKPKLLRWPVTKNSNS